MNTVLACAGRFEAGFMRGTRPVVAIETAKKFAERQGYRWIRNPEPDMPFDAVVYRKNDMIVVRIRTLRHAPAEYDMFEDFFREDFEILDALPFPQYVPREIWARYVWSRTLHRFRMHDDKLMEITMIDREKPVFERKKKTASSDPSPPSPGGGAVK